MSLDVYLTLEGISTIHTGDRIFIREHGRVIETTPEEWVLRFPDREHGNRSYTHDQALVIRARVEPGLPGCGKLHVVRPGFPWPTVAERFWVAVDHPAGPISEAKWKELILKAVARECEEKSNA